MAKQIKDQAHVLRQMVAAATTWRRLYTLARRNGVATPADAEIAAAQMVSAADKASANQLLLDADLRSEIDGLLDQLGVKITEKE